MISIAPLGFTRDSLQPPLRRIVYPRTRNAMPYEEERSLVERIDRQVWRKIWKRKNGEIKEGRGSGSRVVIAVMQLPIEPVGC